MTQIHGITYYSPADVGRAVGVNRATVSRYIRRTNKRRERQQWTRFDENQFKEICALFRRLQQIHPKHPLRALNLI